VLNAPIAANNDQLAGRITFNQTDLTGVTITLRACVVAGDASGALQMAVQDKNFGGDFGVLYKSLSAVMNCADGMQDLPLAIVSTAGFDATAAIQLLVLVQTNNATGPYTPAIVHIDSITSTGDAIGPYPFTSNASAFAVGSGAVAGSSISWIP
jgi:hypothetical protein